MGSISIDDINGQIGSSMGMQLRTPPSRITHKIIIFILYSMRLTFDSSNDRYQGGFFVNTRPIC